MSNTFNEPAPWDDVPLFEKPTAPVVEALPWVNTATGEILEAEPVADEPTSGALAPLVQVALTPEAVAAAGDDVAGFTRDLRDTITARMGEQYSALIAARPAGPLTVAVEPELRYLAAASDTFDAVGKVLTDAAKMARGLALDAVLEAKPEDADRLDRSGGSTSLRVGRKAEGGQGSVKVAVTQRTEVVTDTPGIIDVVVAHLLNRRDLAVGEAPTYYADGIRDGIEVLGALTSPPKWKTTALDALALELDDGLKARLVEAYHRRPVGEATAKIETTP